MTRYTWSVDEIYSRLAGWLDDPRQTDSHYSKPLREIRESLSATTERDWGLLSIANMDWIGDWFQIDGAIRLLSGDENGWLNLRKGLHWAFLSLWIRFERKRKSHPRASIEWPGSVQPIEVIHSFAHACGTRDDTICDYWGRLFEGTASGRLESRWRFPYEAFELHLYFKWKQDIIQSYGVPSPALETYRRVFDAWENVSALGDAIIAMCDYHCSRTYSPNDEEEMPEFNGAPQEMFPADVLSLRRVRDDLGLATPDIDHPLLRTPLMNVPTAPVPFEDDLMDQVTEDICRRLSINPWWQQ